MLSTRNTYTHRYTRVSTVYCEHMAIRTVRWRLYYGEKKLIILIRRCRSCAHVYPLRHRQQQYTACVRARRRPAANVLRDQDPTAIIASVAVKRYILQNYFLLCLVDAILATDESIITAYAKHFEIW